MLHDILVDDVKARAINVKLGKLINFIQNMKTGKHDCHDSYLQTELEGLRNEEG